MNWKERIITPVLKIGDRVMIKGDWGFHSDWLMHKDDIGVISHIKDVGAYRSDYTIGIIWDDGGDSTAPPHNIIVVR